VGVPSRYHSRVSEPLAMYGPRFESALSHAAVLHHGQRRKGNGVPYIVHPLAVASLVGSYGGDEDQVIAALLHDVLEDCGVEARVLHDRYGERVARIVVACTDTTERPKPAWRPRKEAHVARVREQPPEVKLVIAADKLHNALSIVRDRRHRDVGESVWERFSADRDQVLWYYGAMSEALAAGWDHPIVDEVSHAVSELG
jgi:(p)ppGpp synthase/HD superfamily hydrolase